MFDAERPDVAVGDVPGEEAVGVTALNERREKKR